MNDLHTCITFLYFIIILSFLCFAYVEFIFLDVWLFFIPHVWFIIMYLLYCGELLLMISSFIQGRK
jgi:hypothetical protein